MCDLFVRQLINNNVTTTQVGDLSTHTYTRVQQVSAAFLLACLRMTWELLLLGAQPLLVAICLKSLDSESIIRFGTALEFLISFHLWSCLALYRS